MLFSDPTVIISCEGNIFILIFKFIYKMYLFLCVWAFCLHTYLGTLYTFGGLRGQKNVLHALVLEL